MSDIFSQIDSDLRKDKVLNFFKKYAVIIAVLLALIIMIFVGYFLIDNIKRNQYETSIIEYLNATSKTDPIEIIEGLNNIESSYETLISGYASINIAKTLIEQGKLIEAQEKLIEIFNNNNNDKLIIDISKYFYIMLKIDDITQKEIDDIVNDEAIKESSLKYLFMELKGIKALLEKNEDAAEKIFNEIFANVDSQSEIYIRAKKFIDIIN
tara:strand:+ start:563 stop:1195 length:633 start_codon:yes stop_codon:yes gene_type:complete